MIAKKKEYNQGVQNKLFQLSFFFFNFMGHILSVNRSFWVVILGRAGLKWEVIHPNKTNSLVDCGGEQQQQEREAAARTADCLMDGTTERRQLFSRGWKAVSFYYLAIVPVRALQQRL